MIESSRATIPPMLPGPRPPLLGRHFEFAELCATLLREDVSIVTLAGSGGIGSTGLAIAVASEVGAAFPDGVWLVPLAAVTDLDQLPSEIARTLDPSKTGGVRSVDRVAPSLGPRRALLVLDTLDQVVDAGRVISTLMDTCPGLTVLATSRTSLRVARELGYLVLPLAMPEDARVSALGAIGDTAAVRMFVGSAQAVEPRLALTAENAPSVVAIRRPLGEMPPATELEADRVQTLPPGALLDRLDRSLVLLTGGDGDSPARQQAPRNAIAGRYDLLSPDLQALLRRLSVFAGGFTVEAAEAVWADVAGDLSAGLAALVDHGLVELVERHPTAPADPPWATRWVDAPAPTYRLLETVRELGVALLAEHGESAAARRSHAELFMTRATRYESAWISEPAALLGDTELHDNWRTLLSWARSTDDWILASRLACRLSLFRRMRGHVPEERRWLEWVLDDPAGLPPDLRAGAQVGLGLFAYTQGHDALATQTLDIGVAHLRSANDPAQLGRALLLLGEIALNDRQDGRAMRLFEECLAIGRGQGSLARDRGWQAYPLKNLAYLARLRGDLVGARTLMEQSLAVARSTEQSWSIAEGSSGLADIAREEGRTVEASTLYGSALTIYEAVADRYCVACTLADIAVLAVAHGRAEAAAELLGAETALLDALGMPLWPLQVAEERTATERVRATLGALAFNDAFARGRRLSDVEAVRLGQTVAMSMAALGGPSRGAAGDGAGLSRREAQVVRLVADGQSDQEIATCLFLSRRTVSTHVSNILSKLAVANRAEAAAWAVRHGLA